MDDPTVQIYKNLLSPICPISIFRKGIYLFTYVLIQTNKILLKCYRKVLSQSSVKRERQRPPNVHICMYVCSRVTPTPNKVKWTYFVTDITGNETRRNKRRYLEFNEKLYTNTL